MIRLGSMKRLGELAIVTVVTIVSFSSNAAEVLGEDRVVVVEMSGCCSHEASSVMETALIDELEIRDFSVIRVAGQQINPVAQQTELVTLAQEHRAMAAVRLRITSLNQDVEVNLWISNPYTHASTHRRIRVTPSAELSLGMLVAVRTAEALRGGLDDLAHGSHAGKVSMRSPNPTAPDAPVSAVHHNWLGVGVDSGFTLSPGGSGIRGTFAGNALFRPTPHLFTSVTLTWSPLGGTYHANDVQSTLTYLMLRGWIHHCWTSPSLFRPGVGIGGGIFRGKAVGETDGGVSLRTARTRVAYLGVSTRLYIVASKRIPMFVDTTVGMLLPAAKIVHGTATRAVLGQPLIELRFGLEFHFLQN